MKPEEVIETYLINETKKRKLLCYKFTSPGNSGVPDRIVVGNGKTVFIELKAPGEEPRPLQKYVIKELKKHGADVRVADTKELIDEIIRDIIS